MMQLNVSKTDFECILKGEKTLDVRPGSESIKRIRIHEPIIFTVNGWRVTVRIKDIRKYTDLQSLGETEVLQKIRPNITTIKELLHIHGMHRLQNSTNIIVFEFIK
ncbi:MAG: ASCH domain-containing protein [Minisyncoccota bacterium]